MLFSPPPSPSFFIQLHCQISFVYFQTYLRSIHPYSQCPNPDSHYLFPGLEQVSPPNQPTFCLLLIPVYYLVIYCCIKITLNFLLKLKATNIYYLEVSVGQESGHGLCGCLCLKVSHRLWWRCSLGVQLLQSLTRKDLLPSSLLLLLVGWSWNLADGQSSIPCYTRSVHRTVHNKGAYFLQIRAQKETKWGRERVERL